MKVVFGLNDEVNVIGLDEFNGFEVDADGRTADRVDSLLRTAGIGGIHNGSAHVAISYVLAAAGDRAHSADWAAPFESMLNYARSKSWVTKDEKHIVAHINNEGSAHGS